MDNPFSLRLNKLADNDPDALQALMNVLGEGKLYKGQSFLLNKEVCRNIYVLQKGIARHYKFNTKGKEYNTWFSFEGDAVMSMESFVTQKPTAEGIDVLEDCEFVSIAYDDMVHLREQYHSIETLFRELVELYYIELERRLYRIQAFSAKQKYQYLVDHKPHFLKRLPQNHIASFLGITKETLSRVRKK